MPRSSISIPSPFGQPDSTSVHGAEVKLRYAVHRSGQLQPLVHDGHALPVFRKCPDAAAQQRRFSAAGRTGKQTGFL